MRPAVFLDRDGVINVDHGYVSRWEEFEFLPNVPETLAHLQDAGYLLIVISINLVSAEGFIQSRPRSVESRDLGILERHGRRQRDGVLSLSPPSLRRIGHCQSM